MYSHLPFFHPSSLVCCKHELQKGRSCTIDLFAWSSALRPNEIKIAKTNEKKQERARAKGKEREREREKE
jgi:hypothetical protein